ANHKATGEGRPCRTRTACAPGLRARAAAFPGAQTVLRGGATMFLTRLLESRRWKILQRSSRRYRRLQGARRSFAPRLETLENRVALSTLIVQTAADSGAGSLRDTIAAASNGDTIRFDPSLAGQVITLTSGPLAITKNLDIEGLGADRLAIDGNAASRVFSIAGGTSATISQLTVTDGSADAGAGIDNAGALILDH